MKSFQKSSLKADIRILTLIGIFMVIGLPVFAEQDIPDIVLSGLNEYKSNGADAALRAWIKGSPIDNSIEALSQANILRQVETMYGKYIGYNLVISKNISASTKLIILTMNYEKGPLFVQYIVYNAGKGFVIPQFNFNTKLDSIMPLFYLK